ncbi:hypothetical protein [Microbacterium sp. A84]|uniref:hypothetical protein n=1 Tax=Microbacterium sp. A84 TaxID=3450715 RepID=UPI003F440E12
MSTDSPDEPFTEESFTEEDGVLYDEEVAPEYGILGFTLRELLMVAVWLVAFVTSFFPLYPQLSGSTIWMQGISWILPIGLPTVAVFLVVLRRLSPEGIRRVGSLGIDQFASVAFSVSAIQWASANWEIFAAGAGRGYFTLSWVTIVQSVAMLALVVLTVFAPLIPGLREDFRGRLVTLAHRNANPVRPVIARPRPQHPAPVEAHAGESEPSVASEPAVEDELVLDTELSGQDTADGLDHLGLASSVPLTSHASGGELGTLTDADENDYVPGYARSSHGQDDAESDAEQHLEPDPEPEPEANADPEPEAPYVAAAQPFWALVPNVRDVFDARGEPLFRIGPDAWALVIEDRGGAYVVRHDDGRVGYLHDIEDITKG